MSIPIKNIYIIKLFAHICNYVYMLAIVGRMAWTNGLTFFLGNP